jgi:signal transduction histidine kinase/ligand-binding sensor domain-containing protein
LTAVFRSLFSIKGLFIVSALWGGTFNLTILAQFRFDSWTTDNGLPQSSINSILQTRDGFLWFTTFGGLVRYDGLRFEVFNAGNTKGLKTSRFLGLFEDREGSLWISTERRSVIRYKDGIFTTYSIENGVPDCAFHLNKDKNDNLLLRCLLNDTNITITQWNGEKFVPYPPQAGEPTKDIFFVTPDQGLWYAENSHLRKFENGQTTVDFVSDLKIKRVFEDSENRVWMAADGTTLLYRLKDGQLTTYSQKDGLFDSRFVTAFEDLQKRIWFGSKDGLLLFKDGKFEGFTIADGLVRGDVTCIYQDYEGTIWVGTTNGLSRITERVATTYTTRDNLAGDNVYPIYQDRAGKIWIGSWFGLTTFENGAFQNVSKSFGLEESRITALFEDRENNFWIGTLSNGIYRVRNGQISPYSPPEISAYHIRAIEQDQEGNIWFGSQGGLIKYNEGSFTKYTNGLSDKIIVQTIHQDKQGQIWVGTDEGLYLFKNGTFTPLTEKDGIVPANVRTIAEDSDSALWFGMYDTGLYRLKDGKFTHFTTNEGLFDNGVFEILEDNQNNFWISCNLGVYRVRKSDLNDLAEGRINKITSVPYNKGDGMLNAECNGGVQPAGIKARDGRLWFPTQQGVVVLYPDSIPIDNLPPPVVIESLTIDTDPVDIHKPVQIQPGQTYLEIHYSGLSFINPELVKFKYKLEGSDQDWIDAGNRRTAFYTHLPPGKYRFTVLAANRDGVWNNEGTGIDIIVLPPFWRTWWFLGFSMVAIALMAYLFYRWRIGLLKKAHAEKESFSQILIESQETFSRQLIESQEAERKRIAGGLHDNLGQHLIIIKNWASLGLKFTDRAAPVREQLNEISETALKALNEVHEIIHDLRPYQIEAIGLNNTIKFMLEQVASSSGINFKTKIDDLDNFFSTENEVIFYRVVQECVSNIVKHSQAEQARVEIRRDKQTLNLMIKDNGCGFISDHDSINPKSKIQNPKSNGFGLTGLGERVRMLDGTFKIQSVLGKGTTIFIDITRDEQ